MKSLVKRAGRQADEFIRFVAMRLVLGPAARVLPRRIAVALAQVLAAPLVLLPSPGLEVYKEMRRAYGVSRGRALALTHGWLGRPLRDYVILMRAQSGRDDLANLPVVERNAQGVRELRESGASYIIATGHFAREAYLPLLSPHIVPGSRIQVSKAPPPQTQSVADRRLAAQFGLLLDVVCTPLGRESEVIYIDTEDFAVRKLYQALREPGTVVNMHIDAPWSRQGVGSFERPFAAGVSRTFATGAAELAQLAGCPIVGVVYYVGDDGIPVLEWGDPIPVVDDVRGVLNRLIDPLEVAVGTRPTQYILDNWGDRTWSATEARWVQ